MADPVPTSQTYYQVSFPEQLAPYAERLLGRAESMLDEPYMQYQGERFAQFTPLQQQAFAGAQGMQAAPQLRDAAAMAGTAGLRALAYDQYQPGQFANFYRAPGAYTPTSFKAPSVAAQDLTTYQMGGPERVAGQQLTAPQMATARTGYAPGLQTYQMGAPERVRTQSFARPGAAEAFMSPYMQSVVERQQQAAQREADIQKQTLGAQFAQAGAFGGGRYGVQQARMAEALARQKGDIQATGLQAAYQQAQQQFNAEQAARMQAQIANQQAGLTTGQQNLAAALGVQQLGTQTGLQTALANLSAEQQANVQNQAAQLQTQGLSAQQALQAALANQQAGLTVGQQNLAAQLGVQQLGAQQGLQAQLANQQALMQAQQAAEQSRQYGYGQQMAGAGMGAQYGQAAAQLGEQSRQYGAGLGLQGLQAALGAAGQLGNLGQTEFGQNMAINQLQAQYGQQQQQQAQNILGAQYQDYLNYLNMPYKQLGFMSDILRGAPLTQTGATVYQQPPSTLGTLAGTAALGKGLGLFAKGGKVGSAKPAGLADLAIYNMGRAA